MITRIAPSPTGALHLGNARTLVLTWLWARAHGATLRFRLEDIDSPRKKPWAEAQMFEDLKWLGLDWDGPVLVQSERQAGHVAALVQLRDRGLVYACACSRRDVEAAQGAPHAEDESQYPGTCRGRFGSVDAAFESVRRPVALRFRVPPGEVPFDDAVRGAVALDPSLAGGDFVVARWDPAAGFLPGYQLAVVLDDAFQQVDHVIRGADLVPSTPRQILLQSALGLPRPAYAHLPLVVGPDGRRLAKRHGDTRIAAYREAGVAAERILKWIARTSGLRSGALQEPAVSGFEWNDLPKERVVVPPHDSAQGPP